MPWHPSITVYSGCRHPTIPAHPESAGDERIRPVASTGVDQTPVVDRRRCRCPRRDHRARPDVRLSEGVRGGADPDTDDVDDTDNRCVGRPDGHADADSDGIRSADDRRDVREHLDR